MLSHELPSNITSYETSYGKPRFVGIPNDDQLMEKSSIEGILKGRTISEVYAQDTAELNQHGVTWDQAVEILKNLALAVAYQNEHSGIPSALNRDQLRRRPVRLPGFGKDINAFRLLAGFKFQMHNPIKSEIKPGEETARDIIANTAPEVQVQIGKISAVINPQTLLQAEAYHLLEKGNAYQMTGNDIDSLIKSFNKKEFDRIVEPWVQEKMINLIKHIKTLPHHEEKIKYIDGKEVALSVPGSTAIDIYFSTEPFSRLMIDHEEGKLSRIELSGGRDSKSVTIKLENGQFFLYKPLEREGVLITTESPYVPIIQCALNVLDTARNLPTGILLSQSGNLHDNIDKSIKLLYPN